MKDQKKEGRTRSIHAIHIYGRIMVKSGNRHNYVSVMIRKRGSAILWEATLQRASRMEWGYENDRDCVCWLKVPLALDSLAESPGSQSGLINTETSVIKRA